MTATLPRAKATDTLVTAAVFFAAAVLLHNGDHVRRGGDSVSAEVFWVGSAAIVLEVAIVATAMQRHPAAPALAAIGGFALAAGYLVVHFTPERSFFSDAFPGTGAAAISWIAGSLETLSALAVGAAGAVAWRHQSQVDWRAPFSVTGALRHPLAAVFAAGNLVIFGLSVLSRGL